MDAGAAIVMTTVESPSDLGKRLVEARLAGCVQEIAIESTYRWEGVVDRAPEVLLLIKTAADRVDAVTAWLEEHHPYEVPEVLVVPDVEASTGYLAWLVGQTRNEDAG